MGYIDTEGAVQAAAARMAAVCPCPCGADPSELVAPGARCGRAINWHRARLPWPSQGADGQEAHESARTVRPSLL